MLTPTAENEGGGGRRKKKDFFLLSDGGGGETMLLPLLEVHTREKTLFMLVFTIVLSKNPIVNNTYLGSNSGQNYPRKR